jgi:hypothetical protein
MANEITVEAEDDLTREQGHARLVIEGLSGVDFSQLSAQTTTYSLRRSGFTEPNLSDDGWQVAEVDLNPIAIEFDSGNVALVVGPNIVEAIEPFSTLIFSLQLPGQPVAETTLLWPDITPPIMRRENDGRALGEAASKAQATQVDDTEEKARAAKLAELEEERTRLEVERKEAEERQAEEKRLADERKIEAAQLALEEEKALAEAEKKAPEEVKVKAEPEPDVMSAAVTPSTSETDDTKAEARKRYYIKATKIIIGILVVANCISLFVDIILNEGAYGINIAFNGVTCVGVILPILIFGSFFEVIRLPGLTARKTTFSTTTITALTVGVIPAPIVGTMLLISYGNMFGPVTQIGIGEFIGQFMFLSITIAGPISIIYGIAYRRFCALFAAEEAKKALTGKNIIRIILETFGLFILFITIAAVYVGLTNNSGAEALLPLILIMVIIFPFWRYGYLKKKNSKNH